ncbi:GntR family transcriptional regulator [Aliiruegeria lutimaris]|uniref:DNA-binding transcriptional regulator, GntR family n=1 Tax=Aliiruegeria lutimaris TaxID=571298 RepID=A0A1G9F0G5_9RHOB|nr:GntR family transcriptional regulator [Aliiruegeria lutimaris]SDK81745.1 DNA-binding transcriptional regulator, GntR family [Aliiruegeria lutimaris]
MHEGRVAVTYDPSRPIGPQLRETLRQQIVQNDLPPGARISEAEIAKKFGISRQPVREAFIKLAEEGLVEIRPQRGTVVRRIDPDEVLDARFVREAVEADIVRMLAEKSDSDVVAELRRQVIEQRKAAETSAKDFILADELFHRTLAVGAGKESVWDIIQGLKAQMDRVRFLSFDLYQYDQLIAQHEMIIDSVEQGDARGAEDATRRHLRAVLDDLPSIMRANPEVFTPLTEGTHETRSIQRRNP